MLEACWLEKLMSPVSGVGAAVAREEKTGLARKLEDVSGLPRSQLVTSGRDGDTHVAADGPYNAAPDGCAAQASFTPRFLLPRCRASADPPCFRCRWRRAEVETESTLTCLASTGGAKAMGAANRTETGAAGTASTSTP